MKRKILPKLILTLIIICSALIWEEVSAEENSGATTMTLSPMYEKLVLNPGESYTGSFRITEPASATAPLDYKVYIQNYYRDENNNPIFEAVGNTGSISEWITINTPMNGVILPNEAQVVQYTINVPMDAPAGGQYALITVGTAASNSIENENSISIHESLAIGYTIYAEITGNTIHSGETTEVNIPSFLLGGNISGNAIVKNTGNVHDTAKYTLQVFPLFSDEELYTDEEEPSERLVLPDRSLYFSTEWPNTPDVGIFKVRYTVEFQDKINTTERMVIKCPLWILFVILFIIFLIILWFVMKPKNRKKSKR